MVSPLKYFPLILGLSLLVAPAEAKKVSWGNSAGQKIYQSDGTSVTSSFSFELGIFDAGFDLNSADTSLWRANWMAFDAAVEPNLSLGFFSSSNFLLNNDVFPEDSQAYIWIYNNSTPGESTEWALISSPEWLFPEGDTNPTSIGGEQWQVSDATVAVFGRVKEGTNEISGSGTFSATPADELFIQTFEAGIGVSVPEPGTATLLVFGLVPLLLRRRRR